MSRFYDMSIKITKYNPAKGEAIMEEANQEWPELSDNWFDTDKLEGVAPALTSNGQDNLCGGESDDDFAVRITKAIWKANGAYCKVEVAATYLDDLPVEYLELEEEQYELLQEEMTNE